jgi:hypothetical protein
LQVKEKILNFKEGSRMADIKFEITRHLGVLAEGTKGWQKEINMVSWNDRIPKLDIRDWGPNHEKMGKGVTLNDDELIKLKNILNDMNLEI